MTEMQLVPMLVLHSLVPRPPPFFVLQFVWHSKADKIVNNFHGQNWFQFHGQIPIFLWSKTLIFLVKTDFLMFRPTNFLVRSQNIVVTNFLVTKFLSQSPFHSNAKISCSTLFHSNFMLNSVPFQQHFMVSHDCTVSGQSRSTCTHVSHAFLHNFGVECSLGTVTILHQRCRI